MNMNQSTHRDIDIIDPNVAPTENVAVPTETPAIPTSGIGQTTDVADVTGLPSGATSTINESIPKPSGFVSADDTIGAAPQQPQSEVGAKDDPRRHEYWQSKHDRAISDNSELQQENDYYKNTVVPVAMELKNHPDLMNELNNRVTGSGGQVNGSPSQQHVAGNQQPLPQMPVRPEKPVTYSEVDAFNDPESESFKFRQSKDEWNEGMHDYYANVEQARAVQSQQQLQQQQYNMHINNIRTQAVGTMGYDEAKAQRFVQYVENPKNITTERLAALFEMEEAYRTGTSRDNVERQRKADEYQRQMEMQKMPTTVSVESGPSTPQLTQEDSFNSWLLGQSKTKK